MANPEKCHILMNVNSLATIEIGEYTLSNSYCKKLFGAKIAGQLNFNNYLEKILRKSVSRYMFWLELELCVFQKKVINERFSLGSISPLSFCMDVS